MFLSLVVLCIVGLIVFKQWKKQQSNISYWKRIDEFEEERKKAILFQALENQRSLKRK